MDTFSHTLWGWGLFGTRGRPWIAALCGSLPDLIPFVPLMIMRAMAGQTPGRPPLDSIPPWTVSSYNITHSFVVAFVVIALVYRFRKDCAFAMLAWPLHILLDFPFHTETFFPTPIFWPLHDYTLDGISWGQPLVWFPNVAGIVVMFIWRYRWMKKRKASFTRSRGDAEKTKEFLSADDADTRR